MSLKSDLYNFYLNANIKASKEPTLLFQSDDWGSQRMPDATTLAFLTKQSWINIDACIYSQTDSLENENELTDLLNVLSAFKDRYGNSPVFTLNMNLFNPDFTKMRAGNYDSYHEMNLEESYQHYNSGNVLNILKEAEKSNLVDIQYHGKQHFNVGEYMNLLQTNDVIKKAAEYEFYALSFFNSKSIQTPFLATYFPLYNASESLLNFKEGVEYFTNLFGSSPKSFIAPVYAWTNELEDYAVEMGCTIIQGLLKKNQDLNGTAEMRKNNKRDRVIQVRNVGFEPSTDQIFDWLNKSLRQIEIAFMLNRPAIISTHRLNYISSLNPKNSGQNLIMLSSLLRIVLQKWPNVRFAKTSQLYV